MRTLVIALLVLALAAGAWLLFTDTGEQRSTRTDVVIGDRQVGIQPDLPQAVSRGATGVDASPTPLELTHPVDRVLPMHVPTGALRGRLLTHTGSPLEGATVSLVATSGPSHDSLSRGEVFAARSTDSDGRFEFATVQAGRALELRVQDGAVRAVIEQLAVLKGETLDFGDLRLPPTSVVLGQITGAGGTPLVGAEVLIGDELSLTNLMERLMSDGLAALIDDLPQHAIAGATTDDTGLFALPRVAVGTVAILARDSSHMPRVALRALAADETSEVNLELVDADDSLAITGTVETQEDGTLDGVWVAASRDTAADWLAGQIDLPAVALVASDGHFRIGGLAAGAWTVKAGRGGDTRVTQPGVSAGTKGLRLALDTGPSLLLRVVDEQNRPVPSFTLHMKRYQATIFPVLLGAGTWLEVDGQPDDGGIMRVPVPSDQAIKLFATAPGELSSTTINIEPGFGVDATMAEPMSLRLCPMSTIRGRVVEAAGGAPIEGAEVWCIGSEGADLEWPREIVVTDETGRFALNAPAAMMPDLRVRAAGHLASTVSFPPGIDREDLWAELSAAGALRINAGDTAGCAWHIEVGGPNGSTLLPRLSLGCHVLSELPPGRYSIDAKLRFPSGATKHVARTEAVVIAGQMVEVSL